MVLTAVKLQRILFLRIKYKVPLEILLSTNNTNKELLIRLDQIIDWFLENYPDLENESVVLRAQGDFQTIVKLYNCSKTKQIVFVILDHFLRKCSWQQQRVRQWRLRQKTCSPTITSDSNNDGDASLSLNGFVALAKLCRKINNRAQIADLIEKFAKDFLKLKKPRRQLIRHLVELMEVWSEDDWNACNSERIEQAAGFLSPYLMQLVLPPPLPPLFSPFNEQKSTETITEPVFRSLTIFLIYCWPEVRSEVEKIQAAVDYTSTYKQPENSMLKKSIGVNFYNYRTEQMVRNCSTQTGSALVEPQSFYRVNTCAAFQKARNDLEIRFQPKHFI